MEKKADPKKIISGCMFMVILMVILFFIVKSCIFGNDEIEKKPLTDAEKRTQEIEKCFSGWDGSYTSLTPVIKKSLNDEDSYKHISTKYIDKDSFLIVTSEFSAKNAFGGVLKESVIVKTDLNCNILEILEWFE